VGCWEAPSLTSRWDAWLWRSPLAAGGRGATPSRLLLGWKLQSHNTAGRQLQAPEWERAAGSGEESSGSLLLQRQSRERVLPAPPLPRLWPTKCCFDAFPQTSTAYTAGLAGSSADERQVCARGAGGGGHPHPLGPSEEPWVLLGEVTFLLATPRRRNANTAEPLLGPGTCPLAACFHPFPP